MKKRLTAILTVTALLLTGCAGNVTSGTESQPVSDAQSGISDNESSDTSSRYEIITATEMAEKMGLGISLGNTMEAYEATDCEKITYEWIPVVGYHAGNNRRYEGGRLQHSSYSCVLGQYDGK